LDLKHAVIELERQYLLDALTTSRWHQAKAAETLGLTYHQLRALLRKYPDIRKP
jgi:psp operon transcriptional activator